MVMPMENRMAIIVFIVLKFLFVIDIRCCSACNVYLEKVKWLCDDIFYQSVFAKNHLSGNVGILRLSNCLMLFPKPLTVISFLDLLYTSSFTNDKPATTVVEKTSVDSATVVKRMEDTPDSVVFNFLRCYAKNVNRISAINLVNNNGSNDSTKFYSVNFPATEIYLNAL